MKVMFFSSKPYDEDSFKAAKNISLHDLQFLEARLSAETADLAKGARAVCVFVNDRLDRDVLSKLSVLGVELVALRCAGFNNVDMKAAAELGISVLRVPAYSPYAVAEHTIGMMLSLNRKIHRAYARVREGNFSLEGLTGFDFHHRTIGIIGTGRIGSVLARIVCAMGMKVLAVDPVKNSECEKLGVNYVDMNQLLAESDVISLHCPLTPDSKHMINALAVEKMKQRVMLINTSRGAILDTCAVIEGLKTKKIGYLGLDVYEQESELFFKDLSCEIIQDDIFQRLLTFPNVLITAHQGFFTEDALKNIADITLDNITQFESGTSLVNEVISEG